MLYLNALDRFYALSIYCSIRMSKPGPHVKLGSTAMQNLRV